MIKADEAIDALRRLLDDQAIDLLARQQPVATDLRMVVTAMRMSSDLERMGDLARHVAKVARLRYPDSAVPPIMRATLLQMGQVAEQIVEQTGSIIAGKDVDMAVALERADDEMDRLHREVFALLLGDRFDAGTEAAVDITLVARYYERYADHAVSVARRVVYLVTGEWRTDADFDRETDLGAAAAVSWRAVPLSRSSARSAALVGHRGDRVLGGLGVEVLPTRGPGRSSSSSR